MVHFALNLGLIQKVLRKSTVAYNNYIYALNDFLSQLGKWLP